MTRQRKKPKATKRALPRSAHAVQVASSDLVTAPDGQITRLPGSPPPRTWILWTPMGNRKLSDHPREDEAIEEAERCARLNPGVMFVVMTPVHVRRFGAMERIAMPLDGEGLLPEPS